jgi:hypothetical protein
VRELGLPGKAQLAGSYCVKAGTAFNAQKVITAETCISEVQKKQDDNHRYDLAEICGPSKPASSCDKTVEPCGINP